MSDTRNNLEAQFHFSVMKWLYENGYKFWWEQKFPNCAKRPDFFVITPDGKKAVIEVKARRAQGNKHMVTRMKTYQTVFGDPEVKFYFMFPEGLYLPLSFDYWCETAKFEVLRAPVIEPAPVEFAEYAQDPNIIGAFFHTFIPTPREPVIVFKRPRPGYGEQS